uniref:Uncharacterized protein n=1 Tax=Romanomermis culicivorax TaxID=13658 RepID=A0A915HVS1_ROMCU
EKLKFSAFDDLPKKFGQSTTPPLLDGLKSKFAERAFFAEWQTGSNFTYPCRSRPAFRKVVLLPWECKYSGEEPDTGFGAHP